MKLQFPDIAIVVLYLVSMLVIGWYYRKQARQNKESYLLGGKKLPWYLLGLSDAADMFDISGTMWMVSLCFVYGFKSIWIPWLWPVFNQIFNMMFLAKWLRRSNADTGAEWLATRFGLKGKGVKASHNIVVVFALIGSLGFLAYNWPLLFLISIIGCIAGTYSAPPTDVQVLKSFYKQVRPWGFWKPVHELVVAEDPAFVPNKRFKLDMFNVVIGIIGQSCLTILPMYLVLWMKLPLLVTVIILVIIVIILKKTWWNKLEN